MCLFDRVQGLSTPAPRPGWWVAPDAVVRAGAPPLRLKLDFGATGQRQSGRGRVLGTTVNRDFSKVEADAIHVTGNARFTQSLPERHPFLMESLDLLAAQPDLGVRITQRAMTTRP